MGGLGMSLFLIAAGAVLAWAVEIQTRGIDLQAVGVILMIVGLIGSFFSVMVTWGGWHPFEREIIREREVTEHRHADHPSDTRRIA